jgi:hypothetical protein
MSCIEGDDFGPGSSAEKIDMNAPTKRAYLFTAGAAAALMLAGTTIVLTPSPAMATQAFAAQTSKACGVCHQNPAGGGKLKAYGEAFKANGNKLPK